MSYAERTGAFGDGAARLRAPCADAAVRAAQFAPFAALSGFGEAVQEAGRRAREQFEAAGDAQEPPDDAYFDFAPDFMDGTP